MGTLREFIEFRLRRYIKAYPFFKLLYFTGEEMMTATAQELKELTDASILDLEIYSFGASFEEPGVGRITLMIKYSNGEEG